MYTGRGFKRTGGSIRPGGVRSAVRAALVVGCALFVGMPTCLSAESPTIRLSTLLDSLDRTIDDHQEFRKARTLRIEQHKYQLHNRALPDRERFSVNEVVAMEYDGFVCDSIIHYRNLNIALARKMNEPVLENHTRMQLAGTLSRSGMYLDALETLGHIHQAAIRGNRQKREYYNACHNLYRELISNTQTPEARKKYIDLSAAYLDSLGTVVDPVTDTELHLEIEQRVQWNRRNMRQALAVNTRLLERTAPTDSKYATVLFWRALFHEHLGNEDEQMRCLILSAIADIRSATADNTSLRLVAGILFREGDIERANRYIQVCMNDNSFYNARLRGVQLSGTVPLIIGSYNAKIDSQIERLRISIAAISAMLVVIFVLLWRLLRQKSKLDRSQTELKAANRILVSHAEELNRVNGELGIVNSKLFEANSVKESYIAQYLKLSSSYMDKLEELRRVINKKLREGKSSEVLKMTSPSTRIMESEVSEFYDYFDSAFIAICPTFVDDFNDLLRPEERIVPEQKHGKPTLTLELRVYALIRLGFHNSSYIARILHYSVNTIYNVRASVKNKAVVERSEFDALVKRIGVPER